jgi:hypothetical protein
MFLIKSFHPKLIVCDHFDNLMNKIDIKTEQILEFNYSKSHENKLNALRKEQINVLEQIKVENLTLIENINNENFMQKLNFLIDNDNIQDEDKLNTLKRDVIRIDCLLLDDNNYENGYSIWITNLYYSKNHLDFLQ